MQSLIKLENWHTMLKQLSNPDVDKFLCFLEKDMLKIVIDHTNKYGESQKDNWAQVDMDEIKGII